jgi:nucleoid DNA-binding protein
MHLSVGSGVEMRGLGALSKRLERLGRNPRTGDTL